jgi:hypothetical protein
VSLFTLHAIWPFLWIWSTLYREDRGWGFDKKAMKEKHQVDGGDLVELRKQVEVLKQKVETLAATPPEVATAKHED